MGNCGTTNQEVRELYSRYASLVYHRCRSILGSDDEAWDATQEVFMKLIKALPSIEKKTSLHSWLLTAGTNHCISVLRKSRSVGFDEAIHSTSEGSGQMLERRIVARQLLEKILGPWNKKIRQVLVLTYIDGYKQEEIARITGMGESTIRKYLTLIRREAQKLKPALSAGTL